MGNIHAVSGLIKRNAALIIILAIIALFLLLRVPALSQDVYGDELYNYYYSYSSYSPKVSFDPTAYSSFFMSIIFYKLAFMICPSIIALRLVSLLFGLGILLLGMKTLDSFFSRKAAIIFGIIYSVIPWAVFTSVLLDNDGTIISFMFMVLIYYTLKFFHENKPKDADLRNKYFIIVGILSGAMILLKYAIFFSIVIFYILMLGYYFLYTKRMAFKKALHQLYIYILSAVISTIIFLGLYALFLGPTAVSFLIKHYADIPHNNFGFGGLSLTFLLQVILLLMIISPIIMAFLLKFIDDNKSIKDKYLIFLSVFYILELSALLYAYNAASINRYAAFLIIPITLLSAIYLSKFFDNKKIWVMAVCALILSVAYFLIDLLPHTILDFYPKTNWVYSVIHLKWNFLVPINGASGPIGFYISFLSIVLSFGICLILAVWIVFKLYSSRIQKKNLSKINDLGRVLLIFSIVALSYGLYVSLQFSYSMTSPSIDYINHQLRIECAPHGYSGSYYVFKNSAGFSVQNQQNFSSVKLISHESENNATFVNTVVNSGENVCVVDFPQISKSSILWNGLNDHCRLEKTYSSNGYVLGYWFKC